MPQHTGVPELDARRIREALGPEVVPIPLGAVREVDSNEIPNWTDSPNTNDPSGAAGLISNSTTPLLEFQNGDTDSSFRLNWAGGDTDPVSAAVSLPNLDSDEPVEVRLLAGMGASGDTPVINGDLYLTNASNAGGAAKREDSTDNVNDTVAEHVLTITDSNVIEPPATLTVELTPAAHSSQALHLYALWVEYWRQPNYQV